MNRAQRRKLKKQMHGQNLILNPDDGKPVDHSGQVYCNRHNLKLENIDHPTEKDKDKIEKVTLRIIKRYDRDGVLIGRAKYCPSCHVSYDLPEAIGGANLDGFSV